MPIAWPYSWFFLFCFARNSLRACAGAFFYSLSSDSDLSASRLNNCDTIIFTDSHVLFSSLIVVQTLLARSVTHPLLHALCTTSELGTYERLGQFSRIPMSLTVNLCDKVLMHSYSQDQNDKPALRRLLKRSMLLMILGVILIITAVTIGLLLFLKLLVGTQWAALILKLWWFGIPVILLTPIFSNIMLFFSALGMQVQLLRNATLNLFTDIVLGSLLVSAFGARGMLIAKSISGAFMLAYQAHVLRRTLTSGMPLSALTHAVENE